MVQLKGIKNIIFDLGDVIINLDQNKTILAFQKLFGNKFGEMEKDLRGNNILEKYETAEISSDEFLSFFKTYNSTLTNQQIIATWNSILLDIPKERLELINQLSKEYRIFLLSNTNDFHIEYIDNYVRNKFNIDNVAELFEKAYYSHEMGLRKPDSKIFLTIINDKNLVPKETLFIDDSEQHIISAKQLNLKTYHLKSSETIVDIFNAD
ncbi:MAG: haloacid dehalogenase [Flavobacteriales bacterium]|nr:MAG: haloacid dehalogenase [Flavobacteriales bacterium]